jgi:lysophospholipase L1-like esterase
MERVVTFAVLGDSAASGVGDSDANGVTRGWAYYLTEAFSEPIVYSNLSRPGAQSSEVLEHQLPLALELEPDICAVIVGGNDALRNGFDPEKYRQNLRLTLHALQETGSQILLLQLHDPTKIVKLPKLLGSVLLRRINAVNGVIQNLAREFDVEVLHTRRISGIYERKVWHIDRMHPSKYGHQLMATHFRSLLVKRNWQIAPIEIDEIEKSSKAQSIKWMLRNGTPWFLKRSVDLFPAAIFLMVAEIIKITVNRFSNAEADIYHPDFSLQSELNLQEVYEERVS